MVLCLYYEYIDMFMLLLWYYTLVLSKYVLLLQIPSNNKIAWDPLGEYGDFKALNNGGWGRGRGQY